MAEQVAPRRGSALQRFVLWVVILALLVAVGWLASERNQHHFRVAAQGSLLAAEVNVVLARHLWPRRLIQDTPLTGADRRALSAYGEEEERIVQERVRVSIDDAPAAPTTTPRSAEA